MSDCIFCKIGKGEIPSHKIYEDEHTLAFLDLTPINKGHTLVIPKEHYENILDTPKETLKQIIITVKKIAIALSKDSEGINVVQNNKKAAGQVVDHIHFHVMPRYSNDSYPLCKGKSYKEGEAEKVAESIKKHL